MTVRLSNSRSNTFRRCQKQYEFKYQMKIVPKERALPLYRGDWLHQLLMVHHDGHDWREHHARLRATNWDRLLDEEKEDLGGDLPQEAERLFKGYLANWREEDKLWRTVDTEIDETVELPNGMKVNIIIDRIVEDLTDHSLWVWDYKTVSRFYPAEFNLIDTQLALYVWSAVARLGYRRVLGAVLDELITKPPTLPKFLEKSQMYERRKNLHCDAFTYYSLLKRSGQDARKYKAYLRFLQSRHHEWWRRTRMPRDTSMVKQVLAEMMRTGENIEDAMGARVFPRTARKECQYDCSYLMPCAAQIQGADISDILRIHYQKSTRPDKEDLKRLWPEHMKEAA